jgi:hypothetical protein
MVAGADDEYVEAPIYTNLEYSEEVDEGSEPNFYYHFWTLDSATGVGSLKESFISILGEMGSSVADSNQTLVSRNEYSEGEAIQLRAYGWDGAPSQEPSGYYYKINLQGWGTADASGAYIASSSECNPSPVVGRSEVKATSRGNGGRSPAAGIAYLDDFGGVADKNGADYNTGSTYTGNYSATTDYPSSGTYGPNVGWVWEHGTWTIDVDNQLACVDSDDTITLTLGMYLFASINVGLQAKGCSSFASQATGAALVQGELTGYIRKPFSNEPGVTPLPTGTSCSDFGL